MTAREPMHALEMRLQDMRDYPGSVPPRCCASAAEWALAEITRLRAALSAPAPDEVVLRVRWEDHPAGHASVLWFGPYRCGEIWRIKDRWYAMTNAAVIERDGYSDRAAAQAALVERAKGGLTW